MSRQNLIDFETTKMKHAQDVLIFHHKSIINISEWQIYCTVTSCDVNVFYFSILHKQLVIMSERLTIRCLRVRVKKYGGIIGFQMFRKSIIVTDTFF